MSAPLFYARVGRICALILLWALPTRCLATGVTIITHGFEADSTYPTWISSVADAIPKYARFPGTNFTTYRMTMTYNGTAYVITAARANGAPASATDSGEIIVELDWSQLSSDVFDNYASTYAVAFAASQALAQTNFISEMNGHALAEFPLHLVGHSRGGSLVSDISRQLGTNGIWVDHLTTLDPYPLNNDGNFNFPATVTDASANNTFATVLFADNYWQNLGAGYAFGDPDGERVNGAYVRQLTSLSGGYNNDHSNVHLWYHGTVVWATPANDTGASITTSERNSWWVAYEQKGTNAGFRYSLIGAANRLSTDMPVGPGTPAIRNGYNQRWDLGAGNANNRTALGTNNGTWASLIKFNRLETNQVVQGQSIPLKFYYQWARPATSNATVSIYLDDDPNVLNNNQKLLLQMNVPGTTMTNVNAVTVSVPLFATNAAPGLHLLLAVIKNGSQTRYLYAPELVQVIANPAPVLDIAQISAAQFRIGVNGQTNQTIVLEGSFDLMSWQPLATNTLTTSRWNYTNNPPGGAFVFFYRARISN
jgi:hypothetical protein